MNRLTPRTSSHGTALLNLGCGTRAHPEWNNLDFSSNNDHVTACNIVQGLPFADGVFDVVYSSHFLEHLSPADARSVVGECWRVLKPAGVLRLVVPDLEYNARLYLQTLDEVRRARTATNEEHYRWAHLNLIDQMVRKRPGGELAGFLALEHHDPDFIKSTICGPDYDLYQQRGAPPAAGQAAPRPRPGAAVRAVAHAVLGEAKERLDRLPAVRAYNDGQFQFSGEPHQWMYDAFSLSELLQQARFRDIRSLSATESAIPDFGRYLLDVDAAGQAQKPNSLFFEAHKA